MAENKNPILVRKISHLTDARYFAAMGVDWMSIHLTSDPDSLAFWHAIREWVEGVKLAAELDNWNEDWLARVVIDAQPDGIVFHRNSPLPQLEGIRLFLTSGSLDDFIRPSQNSLISSYPDAGVWKKISDFPAPDQFFLEADWTVEMMEELLAEGYNGGFCFRGGSEEEKGIRDYESMDELLGILGR